MCLHPYVDDGRIVSCSFNHFRPITGYGLDFCLAALEYPRRLLSYNAPEHRGEGATRGLVDAQCKQEFLMFSGAGAAVNKTNFAHICLMCSLHTRPDILIDSAVPDLHAFTLPHR